MQTCASQNDLSHLNTNTAQPASHEKQPKHKRALKYEKGAVRKRWGLCAHHTGKPKIEGHLSQDGWERKKGGGRVLEERIVFLSCSYTFPGI